MSDADKKPSFDLVVREKFALVTEKINEWTDPGTGEKDENHYARLGWKVIVIGLGGFFLWATFAPLDKDSNVKYPIKYNENGTIYGSPVAFNQVVSLFIQLCEPSKLTHRKNIQRFVVHASRNVSAAGI